MFSASSKTCRSTAARSAGIRHFRSPATSLAEPPVRSALRIALTCRSLIKLRQSGSPGREGMAERAPFLSTAYGAYHHRERPADDEEFTRVGPGTPCGEYLRRFWQPIILSEELRDLPRRLRILGEDLVVFRDQSGAVGLLELHCPHRGTSLEFGLISEKGIRCCYHGWLFDTDGTILETPGEPSDSTLKERLYHGAYSARE